MYAPKTPDAVELVRWYSPTECRYDRYERRSRADELVFVGSRDCKLPDLPQDRRPRRRVGIPRSLRLAVYEAALQGSKAGYRDAGKVAREALRSKA
jgi:hypothetical protein